MIQNIHLTIIYVRCVMPHSRFPGVNIAFLVANAIVNSRFNYCNSLQYEVNRSSLFTLQKVQNAVS